MISVAHRQPLQHRFQHKLSVVAQLASLGGVAGNTWWPGGVTGFGFVLVS